MAKVTLAAAPAPTLFVSPVHPFLDAAGSCVAKCLPTADKKGARRLATAEAAAGGDDRAAGGGALGLELWAAAGGGSEAGEREGRLLLAPAGGKQDTQKAAPPACASPTDPGNLLEPGVWSLAWSLDGGKTNEVGPFQGALPAAIKLDKLATALKVRRGAVGRGRAFGARAGGWLGAWVVHGGWCVASL
ncbi:hypothetical protein MNEG_6534 [Monoraphidium neglectum]|uniref:Uncharacterized protein n=1 Tax=Monoraphidium neglectum TaxID=145388 RepID=A0A0D2L2C4_9CHLO|nr:hypothetical protein MNEG_6534 [Monoraphidium neglectum]KIZ01424.1 hypothetical protein MNEG_6534 [Monoraphidium neglectum]|eukprot:XP_013900443.1 hypothetical protein MNEG_6534 [Monoraphidium neglectum]